MINSNSNLVSIITPTFNSQRFIQNTIRSAQKQTYSNWEMIIIDDCSSDNTVSLVREEQKNDSRIKLIIMNENSGAAEARNAGMKEAKGKYIAFLDSDDEWVPSKLNNQLEFMQKHNYAFTFSSYSIMDENGRHLDKEVKAVKSVNYKMLLRSPGLIGCLTVVLDKEKIKDTYMPNIKTRQDFALWLKILKEGYKAYGVDQTLAHYRKVPGSISSNKFKAAKKNWYVYRHIEKLNVFMSCWYFLNYAVKAIKKTLF